MLTLIFNGSPRRDGDTAALIDALVSTLVGDVRRVDCYTANIRACSDCRACVGRFACAIQDDMQAVYADLLAADNIVIASPVYFSELTGSLLAVLSRLQPGFYAQQRGETGFCNRPRRGGILLAGGGSGTPDPAIATARRLLRAMNCVDIAPAVTSLRTDAVPAARDAAALAAARTLGEAWNQRHAPRAQNSTDYLGE